MDQLTSCKTCSREVAQSATVCPHCGAKLKLTLIEKLILFVLVKPSRSRVMSRSHPLSKRRPLSKVGGW